MRNRTRVFGTITLYIVVILFYSISLILGIESIPLYIFLTIGSVVVLSTGTIYTIIHSKEKSFPVKGKKKFITQKKYPLKKELLDIKTTEFIEDYFEANPLVDKYADSNFSYESFTRIDEYIFSFFTKEELDKINLLDLSKMDKIFFIRELLYFDQRERVQLIEAMIKGRDSESETLIYTPPKRTINIDEKIRVYVRSLKEPGEKTKIMIIQTAEFIKTLKEKISVLFDYKPEDFLLSSGGILLEEDLKITDYNIEDDDEIALIPSKKKNL